MCNRAGGPFTIATVFISIGKHNNIITLLHCVILNKKLLFGIKINAMNNTQHWTTITTVINRIM